MPVTAADEPFDHQPLLRHLPGRPGVYRMIDASGQVLYVGKAKDLRRRVSSYFSRSLNTRLQSMTAQIRDIQVAVTQTEAEALILENNLIKSLKPRYNVLLRDDKSYPYIFLSAGPFPRLAFHRGSRRAAGRYFGPYPSAGAVRQTLHLLQKLFPVRQCEDSFFQNRSRPCLQHQIKRCTAPCVGLVTPVDYGADVADTVLFLEGRTNQVIAGMVERMEAAAAQLAFEQAARLRDQIATLQRVQERQYVSGERGDLDILACVVQGGLACIQVFFVRAGRNLGNKAFFPRAPEGTDPGAVISAFIAQHYLGAQVPAEILVSQPPEDAAVLESVLGQQAGHRVRISSRVRGERARWVAMARQNAELALEGRLANRSGMRERLEALQAALDLDEPPSRLECFDISHTAGEAHSGLLRGVRYRRPRQGRLPAVQHRWGCARGRLRRHGAGRDAPLSASGGGGGAYARPAPDRRRQGPAQGGGRGARGARRERRGSGGCGQGLGAQARDGATVLVGPRGAHYTGT